MKRVMFAAALLACACAPASETPPQPQLEQQALPISDAAGNRMEALTEKEGRWCTADDSWCVSIGNGAVTFAHAGLQTQLLSYTEGTTTPGIWPAIIREGENDRHVIIGLAWSEQQMYSGGGANVTKVTLYRITQRSGLIPEVLTWPQSADISTRACFSEEDTRNRRDACHDEYRFSGELSLDEANASGPPRLRLSTIATTYPGVVSRNEDSTENPPLGPDDLVVVRDETCSYQRTLTLTGPAYEYDTPPPACEGYLEP